MNREQEIKEEIVLKVMSLQYDTVSSIRKAVEIGIAEGKKQAREEIVEWLEWLSQGNGYTKEYYIDNIKRKFIELKSKLKEEK